MSPQFDVYSPPFVTGALTTSAGNAQLNLVDGIGQRAATFRFSLINGLTGQVKTDLTPLRNATLSHDTTRTIKRQLVLNLGVTDTPRVNPLVDRVLLYMVLDGVQYPMGKYMFTDSSVVPSTGGDQSNVVLNDEMFLVDQQITAGINGVRAGITDTILATVKDLPIQIELETSFFEGSQAWTIGTGRGQILEDLALSGDLFSPWFDNNGVLRFIRSFDPALSVPDFNYDEGNQVIRNPITETSDILTAPNRFVVISNASQTPLSPVIGIAEVPVNAPNSFTKRGFYITNTQDLQILTTPQAQAVAINLALRRTAFERVTLTTPPDPRHDSYNVIRWQGANWLELSWSMSLMEGGAMSHLLRKAYT